MWKEFWKKIYRFAYSDMVAGSYRPKVFSLFARWAIMLPLLVVLPDIGETLLLIYLSWAWKKNRRYVHSRASFWILPWMQVSTDFVVMVGSLHGLKDRYVTKKY